MLRLNNAQVNLKIMFGLNAFLQPLRVTKFPLKGNGEEEETKLTELAKLAAFRPRSYRLSYALRSDDRLLMLTICGIVELSDNSE